MIDELRQARRSMGLSQSSLAELIGADAQTIKRLERGVGSTSTLLAAMAALRFRLSGIGPGLDLPAQLRARRLAKSMSLASVAARARLSRLTVARLERGEGSVASMIRLVATLAPDARRRAPERSYWGEGDKRDRDSRFTPSDFLANVVEAFGGIDLDPCAHPSSPVVAARRIVPSDGGDGLVDDWSGRLAFVNPPFSNLLAWLKRAHEQWRVGNVETVVCLIPVRTDSAWFHETLSADADVFLLRGRVRFLDPDGAAQATPFSLMVLTLGATAEQRARYQSLVPGFWIARAGSASGPR